MPVMEHSGGGGKRVRSLGSLQRDFKLDASLRYRRSYLKEVGEGEGWEKEEEDGHIALEGREL